MKRVRKIVKIDTDLCNGCGACIPNCHEGALQVIDGKARLISDIFCDGLGACIGHCPLGAISIVKQEAEDYDEIKVMDIIIPQGINTIQAHLNHLYDHNEKELLSQALGYLKTKGIDMQDENFIKKLHHEQGKCSGGVHIEIRRPDLNETEQHSLSCESNGCQAIETELRQWPVQLHLLNPNAGYFKAADVLLSADCCAFAFGDFHRKFIKNKVVAIACPKLDSNKQLYVDKITEMIDKSQIKSLTVVIMEVPCCCGLMQIAKIANEQSINKIPINTIIIGINGDIKTAANY